MKVIMNDDEIIVFLNKRYFVDLDFENEQSLEEQFKKIFQTLTKDYNVENSGYYNIDIYKDNNYGLILKIIKEESEYYNYFTNQIDMNINIHKDDFLYEIDYISLDKKILNYVKTFKYKNKIYLKIIKDIDDITLGYIVEMSEILYGNKSLEILKIGKEVKI